MCFNQRILLARCRIALLAFGRLADHRLSVSQIGWVLAPIAFLVPACLIQDGLVWRPAAEQLSELSELVAVADSYGLDR
jgi:hypothetical protein